MTNDFFENLVCMGRGKKLRASKNSSFALQHLGFDYPPAAFAGISYLRSSFPRLSYILRARPLDWVPVPGTAWQDVTGVSLEKCALNLERGCRVFASLLKCQSIRQSSPNQKDNAGNMAFRSLQSLTCIFPVDTTVQVSRAGVNQPRADTILSGWAPKIACLR